jgi:hypothetical protein
MGNWQDTHLLFLKTMLNTKQKPAKPIPAVAAIEYMETNTGLLTCSLSLAAPSYGSPSERKSACMQCFWTHNLMDQLEVLLAICTRGAIMKCALTAWNMKLAHP